VKKISLNLIDRAVALVNPQAGVQRAIARAKLTHFDYDATKYNRERKGPSVLQGAESYRTGYDRIELMRRSRDLAENVGLVRSILMKFASHTAANVSYQARTSEPAVNTDVESFWSEWWDNCDISTRHTGSTLMQVAIMSMLRDGDFLFLLIRDNNGDLKLQGIEADRLGNPFQVYTSSDLIGGIHIDQETGAPTAYDIFARSIGNAYTFQQKVSASQAFHLYDPLRIDQYRGISAFHTAINDAQDIYDIINFEKMSAKVASSQSAIVLRNNNNASDLSDLTSDTNFDNQAIKLETMESGKVSYLEPGETIQFPDGPNRPSGAFAEFHKILLRNICLGVGIPYSFAVDPSAMSGPTARLEMQQAGRTFRRYQKLLDDKVLRPIKNIVIADAVARGLIENNSGSRTTKGIFNFGANVSIDLGRESASAISEFKTGLRTAADIYAERGQDFESAMRQRAIEAKLIKDLAEKYGVAPETISDIVTPTPPQPQFPTPAPKPVTPKNDKPEEGDDEGGGDEATPEDPIEPSSEELEIKKKETELDCGTGSGGFKEGNTCSGGEGGGQDNIKENPKFPMPGVQKISSKGLSVRMADLKIAEENLKNNKPSITPNAPVDVEYNIDTKKYELLDGYHRYLKARGGTIEKASKSKPVEILSKVKLIKNSESKFGGTRDLTEKEIESYTNKNKGKKLESILQELDPASIKMLIEGMMGGIELAKYDGIDFTPPQGARDAAKRALEVRETKPPSQRGMTPVGIARARDLQNGVKLSPDTVRRMLSFLARHEVDKKGSTFGEQGKGWQAWNGWGGDAGYSWAKKIVGQMDARDKKTEFVAGRDCGQDEGGTFGSSNKCAVGYGRPPLKGGYTPTRPGGKIPSDYKRPTEQKKEKPQGKPLPPKPLPPKPLPPKPLPPKPEQTKEQKQISDISEKLKKDGVINSLPDNLERAKEIESSYDNLKAKGYSIPPPKFLLQGNLEENYGASYAGSYAVATTLADGSPTIIFDKKFNAEGNSLKDEINNNVKIKWLATNDLFAHEYGHNAHMKSLGEQKSAQYIKQKLTNNEAKVASEVSDYAKTNPLEFVAETFAGHLNGKKYSKSVYNLYKSYGGPKLR